MAYGPRSTGDNVVLNLGRPMEEKSTCTILGEDFSIRLPLAHWKKHFNINAALIHFDFQWSAWSDPNYPKPPYFYIFASPFLS